MYVGFMTVPHPLQSLSGVRLCNIEQLCLKLACVLRAGRATSDVVPCGSNVARHYTFLHLAESFALRTSSYGQLYHCRLRYMSMSPPSLRPCSACAADPTITVTRRAVLAPPALRQAQSSAMIHCYIPCLVIYIYVCCLLRLRSVATEPLSEAPVRLRALRVGDLNALLRDLGELVLCNVSFCAHPTQLSCQSTHLVHTPSVTVVEHLHALVEDALGLLLGQQVALAVDARLGLVRLAQQGLGEVHAEAGRERRGSVRRAQQVDVAEEGLVLLKVPAADEARVPQRVDLGPARVEQVRKERVQVARRQCRVVVAQLQRLLLSPGC